MRFCKMNGLGNDYIFVDTLREKESEKLIKDIPRYARAFSDRNFGIGGDGLVLIGAHIDADCSMRIFNADGTEATMCGNAIRCVAKYMYEQGEIPNKLIKISTLAGIREAEIITESGVFKKVRVDMGAPALEETLVRRTPTREEAVELMLVNVGNLHAVWLVDECSDELMPAAKEISTALDRNVEIVKVVDRRMLEMRVCERGSGETLACGTGASAAAYACMRRGLAENRVQVVLRGGSLEIEYAEGRLYMSGGAAENYRGEINLTDYGQN